MDARDALFVGGGSKGGATVANVDAFILWVESMAASGWFSEVAGEVESLMVN